MILFLSAGRLSLQSSCACDKLKSPLHRKYLRDMGMPVLRNSFLHVQAATAGIIALGWIDRRA